AVGGAVDDVARREARRPVEFGRGEHPQGDVHDDVGDAADVDGDQGEAVLRGDGIERFVQFAPLAALPVVANQESGYAERAGFLLWRQAGHVRLYDALL